MRLDFDAPGSRIGATSWVVLALGVLAAAWVAQSWQAARLAERQAQAAYAAASDADQRARRQATTARRAEPPARQQRARNDAALARALALSWEDLLLPLQQAVTEDVALLELDADAARGEFSLSGAAKGHEAMLRYLRRLHAESGLGAVSLVRHETRELDGLQGVLFTLRGTWGRR